jgi:hypothetical protein
MNIMEKAVIKTSATLSTKRSMITEVKDLEKVVFLSFDNQ